MNTANIQQANDSVSASMQANNAKFHINREEDATSLQVDRSMKEPSDLTRSSTNVDAKNGSKNDKTSNVNTQSQTSKVTQGKAPLFLDAAIKAQESRLDGKVFLMRPMSHNILSLFFLIIAVLVILFISLGNYTRKVTVVGSLRPIEGINKIYSKQTGIVTEIYVEPGDVVAKNQMLAKISSKRMTASNRDAGNEIIQELNASISSLKFQLLHLNKQLNLDDTQLTLKYKNTFKVLDSLSQQNRFIQKKLSSQLHNRDKLNQLAVKRLIAQHDIDMLDDKIVDINLQLKQSEGAINEKQHQLDEIKIQIDKLPTDYAFKEEQLKQQIAAKRQALADIKANQTSVLVAPVQGRVATMLVNEHNRVSGGQAMMTILPEWSVMEAEVFVPAAAISFIAEGQDVRVQYEALPVQRFGTFSGTVKSVSESTINPGEMNGPLRFEQAVYKVLVELDEQNIAVKDQIFPLLPGMMVKIDMLAERMSVIEWLLEPVWDVKERF